MGPEGNKLKTNDVVKEEDQEPLTMNDVIANELKKPYCCYCKGYRHIWITEVWKR